MDKRERGRADISVEVGLSFSGRTVEGLQTSNLSIGGLYIEPGNYTPPEPGTEVELRLRTPKKEDSGRRLLARVVHVEGNGMGLMFCDFSLDDFGFILQLTDEASTMP